MRRRIGARAGFYTAASLQLFFLFLLLGSSSAPRAQYFADAAAHAEVAPTPPTETTTPSSLFLTPCEIFWDSPVRLALSELQKSSVADPALWETALRNCYHQQHPHEEPSSSEDQQQHQQLLQLLTLTLVGYKGGTLMDQTNQDRAFVYRNENFTVSGVLDGHGSAGHFVAEWSRHELLQRLPPKLLSASLSVSASSSSQNSTVARILSETLVKIDQDLPDSIAYDGGATASFVVLMRQDDDDDTLYFCNAGDSKSFLVAAIVDDDDNKFAVRDKDRLSNQSPQTGRSHRTEAPRSVGGDGQRKDGQRRRSCLVQVRKGQRCDVRLGHESRPGRSRSFRRHCRADD